MSLQVRYKNIALTLQPGQSIEIERNNPMFMFDSYIGEYSSQIILLADEHNRKTIGNDLFLELSRKSKVKIEVSIYDGETFAYNATAILSSNYTHRLFENKGNITANLLFGFSRFYNKIKDKKARTLYLGGEITKDFTTSNVTDSSDGYLQHFHLTRNNTENYLFAPIVNDSATDDNTTGTGFINPLDSDNNLLPFGWLSLQPRVKYVLEQILYENGYLLDDSLLTSTGWENLFYVSFQLLKYYEITWTQTWLGSSYDNIPSLTYLPSITYKIADSFSAEVTVVDLFFETCKRYGWMPLFGNNNVCKLYPLKKGKLMERVDFTKYAAQDFTTDFSADEKKFSFKNTFPSGDSLPSEPNFENLKKETSVLNFSDLPSPLGNYDNSIIYVANENKYYKIDLDETTNQRIWVLFTDNIYDAIATNETDSIESKVTTLPIYKTLFKTVSSVDYYAYLPWAKQDVQKDAGIRTLYYHGLVKEILLDGTEGVLDYPYLSSICVIPNKTINADWSNVFTNVIGSIDYGIINYWFKDWIDLTGSIEETEQKIWLPYNEMRNLQFDKQILLFNKPHLLKSYIEPLPYIGFIQAKTLAILKAASATASTGVYAKLVWEDTQPGPDISLFPGMPPFTDNTTKSRPVVYVYADAAGTIPLSVINLNIKLKHGYGSDDAGTIIPFTYYADFHFSLTGTSKEICNTVLHSDTSGYYDIYPNSLSPFMIIKEHIVTLPSTLFALHNFILDTSSDYTIIP